MTDWQDISTAPEDGTPFQVWMPKKSLGSHIHTAVFHPKLKTVGHHFLFDLESQPTHWQPLPQPPEQETE